MLTVMGGTLSSRLLGLLRQSLFNRLFPIEVTDAFNIAFRVPNLFRELLAEGALTSAVIPILKALPELDRRRFAGSLAMALAAINLIVVGFIMIFAPAVVGLLVEQGASINVELAVQLTRIVAPFLAGISFSALAMALLNAEERFAATSFSPLAFSVVSILGFLIFPGNAFALGWLTTAGGVAQLLVQLPALVRAGLFPRPQLKAHPALWRTLGLMLPFAFTTSTRQFLNIVLSRLVSRFGSGAVTGFGNADLIFQLALGLFAVSPAVASYSRLADEAGRNDWPAFRETVLRNLRLILFLCAPVAALIYALSPSVVSAVIELAGHVEQEKYLFTVLALPPLALAILPWGINQYLVRTFYVRQRPRDAIVINVIGFGLNTLLYIVLAPYGFAVMNLSTAIAGCCVVGVYGALLHRQVGLPWRPLVRYAVRVIAAAMITGLVASFIHQLLPGGRGSLNALFRLVVAGGLGAGLYIGLCLLLRVPEFSKSRPS